MNKTEKIVTDFMKETMPFTYKANNDGRLMTNLANFYDWLELKNQLPIHGVSKSFYCQSDIEMDGRCDEQCHHCKEYYKPVRAIKCLLTHKHTQHSKKHILKYDRFQTSRLPTRNSIQSA